MRHPLRAVLVSLLAAPLLACGPGVEEGPVPAADIDSDSDTDSDADGDTDSGNAQVIDTEIGYPDCPQGISQGSGEASGTLLSATDVGPGVELVAFYLDAVLAREDDGATVLPIVIAADFMDGDILASMRVARLASTPEGPLEPVGIASALKDPFSGCEAIALVQESDGAALYCSTAEVNLDGDLSPLAGGEVPHTGMMRGLAYLRRMTHDDDDPWFDRLCAFGDGLFCFDGAVWQTELSPDSGSAINDLTMIEVEETGLLVAVGDEGRIALRLGGGWQELDTGLDADLLTATAHGPRFTAAGTEGVLVDGLLDDLLVCDVGDETIVSMNWWQTVHLWGITSQGRIFDGSIGEGDGGHLTYAGGGIDDPLDTLWNAYGGSDNFLVLSPEAIWGNDNAIVIE